jgi:hypothetical protein
MAETRAKGRRAFSIGSVLARSFRIWGRNLIPFTIMSVIVYAPLVIFLLATPDESSQSSVTTPGSDGPEYDPYGESAAADDTADLVRTVITLILMIVLPYVVTGALIYGVLKQLHGEPAGMGDCLRVGFARLFPIFGVGILAGLLSALGAILLIIPGVIIACMYWVAVPVAVVERPGVIASLKRSSQLTYGEKGSIFVILLILVVLQNVSQFVVDNALSLGESTAGVLASLVPTVVFGMLGAIACAVGYHDLRVAKEGVGIEQLVSVFA